MFLDEVRIQLSSGKGGDGVVHFRREKYVPRGGPDGGDGGRGGSILFQVSPHLNSLTPFRRQRHYKAEDGRPGGSSNKTGADGADLVLQVPPGTQVRAERDGDLIADLVQTGEQVIILSTDTEIDHEYRERLSKCVGLEYHIEYNKGQKSSTITPGYF